MKIYFLNLSAKGWDHLDLIPSLRVIYWSKKGVSLSFCFLRFQYELEIEKTS